MKVRKTTLKKRLKKSQYIINELTNKIESYERTIDSQEEEIFNLEKYTQELQKNA